MARARWLPLLLVVVVGYVILAAVTPRFGSTYNGFVILQIAAVNALVGLSELCVLAVGDLSLAVGGIGALVTVVAGYLFEVHHWPVVAVVLLALVLGAVAGLVNGILIGRTGLSGFVITLATGAVFTGIAYGMTDGLPYATVPSVFVSLGQGRISFLPYALILTMVISAIVAAAFRWLPVGRELLAVGGNREAALFTGLSRQRAILIAHAASGLLAAVAALLYIGILRSATPASGSDWLITSFAVAIIGGTALTGGEAPVFGCFVAGLVLATINNALIVRNVNSNAVQLAEGILIFAAVGLGKVGGIERLSSFVRQHRGGTIPDAAIMGEGRYESPDNGGTRTP